jgi:hypothetical protein
LSAEATYSVDNGSIVQVSASGRVTPLADGTAMITIRIGELTASLPAEVRDFSNSRPVHFANQIVPVLTKLGCNSGSCHGKQNGQNGFRLSLLGFEPEEDYTSLVKESRGRRIFPEAPDQSLLLLKPTGTIAHGGGRRLDPSSGDYRLIRRWIADGMPGGAKDDPVITHISVQPESRVLSQDYRQQLAVIAHHSDGRCEDVTRLSKFESNDAEIAAVDDHGFVRTKSRSGQAAVMARYQKHVGVFRAIVPRSGPTPDFEFSNQTQIDRHTANQWRKLGLTPSAPVSDERFLRRVNLDLTGTLPTAERVRTFVADRDPEKRAKLIDELLASPEYAEHFANKWSDVLRVKRRQDPNRAAGTFAFREWIRDAIAADLPFDQFARAILTATGDETRNPPVVWYKEVQTPEQFVDDVSQVFLGQRVACAQCHHHPYEKWSQDDFWGMAAFFSKVGRKARPIAGAPNQQRPPQMIYLRTDGTVTNRRANRPAAPKPLDADIMPLAREDDPRPKLVDWIVDPKNPFFARALVNRYWAHFFSRGIVEPPDDMRATNPPTNPELLDALAKSFVESKYSLKALVREICTSATYQIDSQPIESNRDDRQNFARYYPRRLSAEVLLDAVSRATDSPTAFAGLPRDRHAPDRALRLPDESFVSYFLDVFGRPQRISACECERVGEANLAQVLHLLNSDEIQGKLSRSGGRAEQLAKDGRPDNEKIEDVFLHVLSRRPSEDEREAAQEQLRKHAGNPKQAFENLLWALLNTKEFLFNQ